MPGSDSTLLKVLSVLPTRMRPLLLAFEVYSAYRNRQRLHDAKQVWETEYNRKNPKPELKSKKRGGMGIGRLIIGAGLAYGVSQLMKTQDQKGTVRSTDFMPERDTTKTTATTTAE
jgi:hypothetical protein